MNYAFVGLICCKIYSFGLLSINDIVEMQVVLQGIKTGMESMAETVDFQGQILNMAVGKLTGLEESLVGLGDKMGLTCSLSYENYQFYEESNWRLMIH